MSADKPSNRLLPFIGLVGTGPKGAKSLSFDQAVEAMDAILDGAYHPVSFGAFLLALRWKIETPEEMAGFLHALGRRLIPPKSLPNVGHSVDSAGAYDGKKRTLNISLASALVAAGAGAKVILHGWENIPTKNGVTTQHLLQRLGIAIDANPDQAASTLNAIGVAYLSQPNFHPQLAALVDQRWALGKRAFFNTIEPLANPLGSPAHIGGFFHRPYAQRIAEAIDQTPNGFRVAWIVQGIEGSDEIRPDRAYAVELRGGEILEHSVESSAFGLEAALGDVSPSDPSAILDESAERLQLLMEDRAPVGYRDAVLLNAALRLLASGKAKDWEEGIAQARASVADGKAREVLERWIGVR